MEKLYRFGLSYFLHYTVLSVLLEVDWNLKEKKIPSNTYR